MGFSGYTRRLPSDNEFTGILQWPGYRVYRHKIDEKNKILRIVGSAQARQPQVGVLRLRPQVCRCGASRGGAGGFTGRGRSAGAGWVAGTYSLDGRVAGPAQHDGPHLVNRGEENNVNGDASDQRGGLEAASGSCGIVPKHQISPTGPTGVIRGRCSKMGLGSFGITTGAGARTSWEPATEARGDRIGSNDEIIRASSRVERERNALRVSSVICSGNRLKWVVRNGHVHGLGMERISASADLQVPAKRYNA